MRPTPLLVALACSFVLAACDSQSQMVVARSGAPVALASGVTLTTVITGSSNATMLVLQETDLPSEIAQTPNLKLVVGGRPMPLSRGAGGTLTAPLPPTAAPPSPDASGSVNLVLQGDTQSWLVSARYNAPKAFNNTPAATP